MKKITLIFCLICCFACQNQQEDKEFDFLYAQYLEYLNENENLVFGIKNGAIRNGKRADDISVLKQAEILIIKRKKFLKLLNLQDPNFVLDKQALRSYSQFLFDYHMDSVKIEPSTEVLELVEKSPSKKNILFALMDLARIEARLVDRIAEKTGTWQFRFGKIYLYADNLGKVGKNWNVLIGGHTDGDGKTFPKIDELQDLEISVYRDGKKIKTNFQKQFFEESKMIYFTFVPTQKGNYDLRLDSAVSQKNYRPLQFESHKFIIK